MVRIRRSLNQLAQGWFVACMVLVTPGVAQNPQAPPAVAADDDSPVLVEPDDPEELFDAAVLSARVARPQVARGYLERFMQSNPDDALLLKIRDKFGPALLLRLAQTRELQPLSVQLLDSVNAAFRRQAADPARIDGLIDGLLGSPAERRASLVALTSGGADVVPRMVERLAGTREGRDLLADVLPQLGSEVLEPMHAMIAADNPDLRAVAAEALGQLDSQRSLDYLWYPAFSEAESAGTRTMARLAIGRILDQADPTQLPTASVAARLQQQALAHFENRYLWPADEAGRVRIWNWDAATETLTDSILTPQAASLQVGFRLARQALALDPEESELQALLLAFALANDSAVGSWYEPVPTGRGTAHNLALLAGAETTSQALHLALSKGNVPAARWALKARSQLSTWHQLYRPDGRRSPIQAALSFPNLAVQLAAAKTVVQIDPPRPFAGSSRVVEILARVLRGNAEQMCLVIDSNSERAGRMAALVAQLGYEHVQVGTGREGFQVAAERSDVALVLMQANVVRWPLSATLANLRADARTSFLPIVVYGEPAVRRRLSGILADDALLEFAPETNTLALFQETAGRLLARTQVTPSNEQRARMEREAVFWLAHLALARRHDVFDLRPAEAALSEATNEAALAGDALIALGTIPTRSAQFRLQQLAVSAAAPMSTRTQAAELLAQHMQRHGLLLDDNQVQQVRNAWQGAQDAGLETALAAAIGSLQPRGKTVSDRLQQFRLQPGSP